MARQITAVPSQRLTRAERIERTNELLREAQHEEGPRRQQLLDEAVRLNIQVARSIAHQFRHRGESAEDLEQVAYLGLTKAVRGFDPSKGNEFLAYAVAKERMRRPLDELHVWLGAHNAAVMSVLLLVIGVALIGKGIGEL